MKKNQIIIGFLTIFFFSFNFPYGSELSDLLKTQSQTIYVGTYVENIKQNSTYNVIISLYENGTGESHVTTRFMPYKGKFKWTHTLSDGYSSITCDWENPTYESNEMMEFFIKSGMYKRNQMQFSLTGIAHFKDAKPNMLLTPVMSEDGILMGEVAHKITGSTYNYND